MKTALTLLAEIQIASPCPAHWQGMVGDDRSRHCLSCDRNVYDLSALTAAQALALIHKKEGTLCVRLFRRADGRVLTADCPVGLKARLAKAGRKIGVATWVFLGWLLFLISCGLIIASKPAEEADDDRGGPRHERREMGKLDCVKQP